MDCYYLKIQFLICTDTTIMPFILTLPKSEESMDTFLSSDVSS